MKKSILHLWLLVLLLSLSCKIVFAVHCSSELDGKWRGSWYLKGEFIPTLVKFEVNQNATDKFSGKYYFGESATEATAIPFAGNCIAGPNNETILTFKPFSPGNICVGAFKAKSKLTVTCLVENKQISSKTDSEAEWGNFKWNNGL